jgi:hypothetical protein
LRSSGKDPVKLLEKYQNLQAARRDKELVLFDKKLIARTAQVWYRKNILPEDL